MRQTMIHPDVTARCAPGEWENEMEYTRSDDMPQPAGMVRVCINQAAFDMLQDAGAGGDYVRCNNHYLIDIDLDLQTYIEHFMDAAIEDEIEAFSRAIFAAMPGRFGTA